MASSFVCFVAQVNLITVVYYCLSNCMFCFVFCSLVSICTCYSRNKR